MRYTKHVVTEMGKDLVQQCVMCGYVVSDYRNAMAPAGQSPPTGFRAGEVFVTSPGENHRMTVISVDSNDIVVDCA